MHIAQRQKLPAMSINDEIWDSLERGDIVKTAMLSQKAFSDFQRDVLSMYEHIEVEDKDQKLRFYP